MRNRVFLGESGHEGLQSFISSIEPIKKLIGNKASYKMFHVEQGLIREVV